MLKAEATHRCAKVRHEEIHRLMPLRRASDVTVMAPSTRPVTRMLNGGISLSAMLIIGQVTPQPMHSTTRNTRALMASARARSRAATAAAGSVWVVVMAGPADAKAADRPDAVVL